MYLQRLFLLNYRNVGQADLQFSPKINCFLGRNGMGKTNLMDAIHYLSFCRSSLASTDTQIISHEADTMMLQGIYEISSDETVEISCTVRAGCRKQMRRDRKEYRKFSDHIGLIPLVMVSPDDILLITGGSEERRKFMDIVISQYDRDYLGHLIKYNKALAQRNALLKSENEPDVEIFLMLESVMDTCANVIYGRRREFVSRLVPLFRQLYSKIGCDTEQVGLSYSSHLESGSLSEMLSSCRAKERIVGYTLHGIHKDELEMTLGGFPIRKEGSQGQNKSYLIALKLAQYLYLSEACNGRKPLLLLDDLFDRLDSVRVENILRAVSDDAFGQIFVTDVNSEHIDSILEVLDSDYKVFTVENGVVR